MITKEFADELQTISESALFTAKLWRAYVMTPAQWNDTDWDTAQAAGLCTRRTNRDNTEHKWVLTDAGLDLMIAGK